MKYTPQLAEPFIGKRVLVSIRDIGGNGEETFSVFCGIIESADVGGLVVRVEGQGDDKYWVMPPDLDALVPAEAEAYEIEGGTTSQSKTSTISRASARRIQ
jgi:hypothetical protein